MCRMCLHGCGILVHVVNGVAVKIEPDPNNPDNLGRLCPKGNAGLGRQYDSSRIMHSLVRTNSERTWEADPKWKEVSMDYALDLVAEKLRPILKKDPRTLVCSFGDFQRYWTWAWPSGAFGSFNFFSTLGTSCGGGYHGINGAFEGTFATIPDYKYCNYLIQIGAGDGFEAHLHLSGTAKRVADARMRGMKLVVLEPRLGSASAKADEWIATRIGTDSAFIMSIMCVMVHELDKYDKEFLKTNTNAPYLIGPDRLFMKDSAGKALVYDSSDKVVKSYDDPSLKEPALNGSHIVNENISYKTAFQIFADKLLDYKPERVEKITTVPKVTIRRIAKELVEAAKIGSTIEIEGRTYNYRPVAIQWYRGSHAHNHSYLDNFTYKMINTLLGNIDMPGGHLGVPLGWSPVDWKGDCSIDKIEKGENGIVKPWLYELRGPIPFKYPPDRYQMTEYFPVGLEPGEILPEVMLNHERYGLPRPEAIFSFYSNPVWNMPGTSKILKAIQAVDFVASIDIQSVSETTTLSDVILADRTYLESWSFYNCEAPFVTGHTLRQPVVAPPPDTMDGTDIITELSERLGILDKWNSAVSGFLGLWKNPKYVLEPNKKYTSEEIIARFAAAFYGSQNKDIEWFKEHGTTMRLKTPEELYFPYKGLRLPFYMEHVVKAGYELEENMSKLDVDWMKDWRFDEYQPLPEWRPSFIHTEDLEEYDLIATYFKAAQINFEDLANVPWVVEVAKNRPDLSMVWINEDTGNRKGIKTGDRIKITSKYGSVEGVAWLTQGIHPEAVMVSQGGRPHIRGKYKINSIPLFNELLSSDLRQVDPVSASYETAARVKLEVIH
jgi:anaerobic selenocysteine-containing dehydrogenase